MGTQAKIFLIGNIGDVQPANSNSGKPYLRLSVAVDDPKDPTTWWNCIIAGKKAENMDALLKLFTKGRLVSLWGKPKSKAYLKQNGEPAVSNSVLVDELPLVLDAKPKD